MLGMMFGEDVPKQSSIKSGLKLTGGITFSTFYGDLAAYNDVNAVIGFRIGIEKILPIGLITGISYTQRGINMESTYYESFYDTNFKIENTVKLNYITWTNLKPISITKNINLLAGFELGYFKEGSLKYIDYGTTNEDGSLGSTGSSNFSTNDFKECDCNVIDFGLVLGLENKINDKMSLSSTLFVGLQKVNILLSDEKNMSLNLYLGHSL